MDKKNIIIVILLIATVVMGSVVNHAMSDKAAEEKEFWVHVEETLESGYHFEHSFKITKPMLEVMIKLHWWTAEWQEDGYLCMRFDDEQGKVKSILLHPYGSELKEVRKIIEKFGLNCKIPEQ